MDHHELLRRIAHGDVANVPFGDMPTHHINVSYSAEDEGFIADAPDLPGCSAFGTTPAEAVREVQIAMDAWLSVARESGHDVPVPRYRPAIYAI